MLLSKADQIARTAPVSDAVTQGLGCGVGGCCAFSCQIPSDAQCPGDDLTAHVLAVAGHVEDVGCELAGWAHAACP
ncbi:hypothetical protein, partial [Escherichia coli]|uniref:hypothetical protein n=1 Tax=Escherichia coli TaxID=562 RepID=UPI001BFE988D